MPDQKVEKIKQIDDKQNPEVEDTKVKQVSEFEKKEIFDPTNIAALIDKSKENLAETDIKSNKITQSQDKSLNNVASDFFCIIFSTLASSFEILL